MPRFRLVEPLADGAQRVSVRDLTIMQAQGYASRGWGVEQVHRDMEVSGPVVMGRDVMPFEGWVMPIDRMRLRPTSAPPNWKRKGYSVAAFRRRTIF